MGNEEGKEKPVEVVKVALCQFRLVYQLLWITADLAIIIHALVSSKSDYCHLLYIVLPLKTAQKNGHQLPWLPICFQVQMLLLTFKSLNDLEPAYPRDSFHPYNYIVRSTGAALLFQLWNQAGSGS